MSAASLAASLAGPDLHPELPPFIIVFHDISRFFLPQSPLRQTANVVKLSRAPKAALDPNATNERGYSRGDKLREGLKRVLVELNPLQC